MNPRLLHSRLRFMSEPAGGEPAPGAGSPPAAPPAPPAAPADEGRTFTQADIDRIVTGRLARFHDYDELRARAEAAANAVAPDEVERTVAAARTEAEAQAVARFAPRLAAAEIRAVAATLGFRDPADALAQYGDLSAVAVDAEGQVDATAVRTRLDEIAKAKPYLLGTSTPPVAPPGAAGIGVGGGGPAGDASVTPGLGRLRAAYGSTPTH